MHRPESERRFGAARSRPPVTPLSREASRSAKLLEGFAEATKLFTVPEKDEMRRYSASLSDYLGDRSAEG